MSSAFGALAVNDPGDQWEREADRVADGVMSGRGPPHGLAGVIPAPAGLHRCACGGACPRCVEAADEDALQSLHRAEAAGVGAPAVAPPVVHDVLATPGHPLDASTRTFMEARTGADFGAVRVHTDARAAESARAVDAHAFTVGAHIVFAAGRYAPGTPRGDHLLAHELAHTLQQSGGARLRRQIVASPQVNPMDDPRMHSSGAPGAVTCTRPTHCPVGFCDPYSSESFARHQRVKMAPVLLLGIAAAVDSRVVPLWRDYLWGGSSPRDLTATFGADFTASSTTATTTLFLIGAMRASLQRSPPSFATGSSTVIEDFSTRLASELRAIGTAGDPHEMNFSIPRDVAGNLAGGIGSNQSACPAGAQPSPFDDQRTARVRAVIMRNATGDLMVTPIIEFTVRDTIDLCPGDCGTSTEQLATVPLSQFEATGIAGDVPFTVNFPAPALLTLPFTVSLGGP